MGIGWPELLIVLVILVLIFGVGRLAQAGSEVGKSIREFRKGLRGDDEPVPPSSKPNGDSKGKDQPG